MSDQKTRYRSHPDEIDALMDRPRYIPTDEMEMETIGYLKAIVSDIDEGILSDLRQVREILASWIGMMQVAR